MVKKSKLFYALDKETGRDYDAEKRKKLVKAALKKKEEKKARKAAASGGEGEGEEREEVDGKKAAIDGDKKKKKGDKKGESVTDGEKEDKDNSAENEDKNEKEEASEDDEEGENENENENEEDNDDDEEEEEEEDIPLSDLSENDQEDVIPHQRLTINNSAAIKTTLKRISFITPSTPFSEHNSLVSTLPISVPDPNDDLTRELEFYKACQDAAVTARGLLKKEGIPFSRPGDYFAEMVKTDEHMEKIKKKLYDEAAAKKASAEAKRQRDLKKFGKQVQVSKLQQRQKEKRETLDKIDTLKKKRKADTSGPTEDTGDLFDVAIEDANKPSSKKRSRSAGKESDGPNKKRQKKDEKFGYGGKKKNIKSGDSMSSSDLRGFSAKKMKAGAKKSSRPGKSKRKAQA